MKKLVLLTLFIVGSGFLYIACDPCGDTPRMPDYYFEISDLKVMNNTTADSISYNNFGLIIRPEVSTQYGMNHKSSLSIPGQLYACDPAGGEFKGFQPFILDFQIVTNQDFNPSYSAGDTISHLVYREIYNARQYISEFSGGAVPENYFDEPFFLSVAPYSSSEQSFTVYMKLGSGELLVRSTEEVIIY